jgi:hypothetical protein
MPDRPLNRVFFESQLEILRPINSYNNVQIVILSPSTSIHIRSLQIGHGQFFAQRSKLNVHIDIYAAVGKSKASEIQDVLNNVQDNKCNMVRPQISETSEGRSST